MWQQARQRCHLCSWVFRSHQQRPHHMCITAHRPSPVPLQIMVTWNIGMLLLIRHLFAACIADVLETDLILNARSSCFPRDPCLMHRPGSISQAAASPLEASGQNNPPGQFYEGGDGPHIRTPCAGSDCTYMHADSTVSPFLWCVICLTASSCYHLQEVSPPLRYHRPTWI